MKRWLRTRWGALVIAIAAVTGFAVTSAVPAQAFGTFRVWSQCPSTNQYQILSIQNQSGARVYYAAFQNGTGIFLGSGYVSNGASKSTAWSPYSVTYEFSGAGSLNWWYQFTCRY